MKRSSYISLIIFVLLAIITPAISNYLVINNVVGGLGTIISILIPIIIAVIAIMKLIKTTFIENDDKYYRHHVDNYYGTMHNDY